MSYLRDKRYKILLKQKNEYIEKYLRNYTNTSKLKSET